MAAHGWIHASNCAQGSSLSPVANRGSDVPAPRSPSTPRIRIGCMKVVYVPRGCVLPGTDASCPPAPCHASSATSCGGVESGHSSQQGTMPSVIAPLGTLPTLTRAGRAPSCIRSTYRPPRHQEESEVSFFRTGHAADHPPIPPSDGGAVETQESEVNAYLSLAALLPQLQHSSSLNVISGQPTPYLRCCPLHFVSLFVAHQTLVWSAGQRRLDIPLPDSSPQ
jgi:hypothetical protein